MDQQYVLGKVSLSRNTQNITYWLTDENIVTKSLQEQNLVFPPRSNQSVFTNVVFTAAVS